ncbi:hypothetical protein [Paenibacillus terrae]|uniref:Uncharacterized protein n=1 Tax=Paenibacillus terrae TaxID=159743 RepID=A0A0D7WTW6_9BACL|nr:hypothetical protein [Paenibacillus terrae]KJD42621.1 hypothetical protein QD47_27210 [Paenibacillus terrae]
MKKETWENTTYLSIDHDFDELQKFFLNQELLQNHARPINVLRSIAKAKAFNQRVRWVFQEAMIVLGILIALVFIEVALVVIQL